jgi:hypothetical protein
MGVRPRRGTRFEALRYAQLAGIPGAVHPARTLRLEVRTSARPEDIPTVVPPHLGMRSDEAQQIGGANRVRFAATVAQAATTGTGPVLMLKP